MTNNALKQVAEDEQAAKDNKGRQEKPVAKRKKFAGDCQKFLVAIMARKSLPVCRLLFYYVVLHLLVILLLLPVFFHLLRRTSEYTGKFASFPHQICLALFCSFKLRSS